MAIYDAEQMINEAQERIARLRRSVKIFKELRDSGEPFPSKGAEQSETDRMPAALKHTSA